MLSERLQIKKAMAMEEANEHLLHKKAMAMEEAKELKNW